MTRSGTRGVDEAQSRPTAFPRRRHPRSGTRALIGSLVLGAMVVVAGIGSSPAAYSSPGAAAGPDRGSGDEPSSFGQRFANADPSAGAMFRWWWPGSAVDEDELVAEVDAIADAGYKGVEIADVQYGLDYPVDPDRYGYGNDRWREAVETVVEAAAERGLQVDLTLGAQWPAAVAGLDVNGDSSSKELTYGLRLLRGGERFAGAVPRPPAKTYDDRRSEDGVIRTATRTSEPRFVAVSAVPCLQESCSATPLAVDLSSQVDLTGRVSDGALRWTPPDERTWVLTGYWYRGTAQRNDAPFGNQPYLITDPESRVVDHFSAAGTEAFIDYFESLLTPDTRRLLRHNGGSLFEDSLELDFSQAWTPDFLAEFRHRRGYSLVPYLPALAYREGEGPTFTPSIPGFTFDGADATVGHRITRDVEQTLSDLYLEDHVEPIKRLAHSLGLEYRAQPYGEPIDLAQASAKVDIAESESLACGTCDDWRAVAAGSDMAGHSIVSDELLPAEGPMIGDGPFIGSYRTAPQEVVSQANSEYAVGANQMVLHGFPYATWPESADEATVDSSARWPGFHAFTAEIPEPFGPRQPTWTMASDTSGYLARTQLLLQAGRRQTDVAVYNQSLGQLSSTYADPGLLDAGYSYGYVTPGSLMLRSASVAKHVLAPDGPAFKALIVDEQASMPLATARRIRELADDGLPVIVVGAPPSSTPGYAADPRGADAALQDAVAALLAEPTVHRVASTAEVVDLLAWLDLAPAATSSSGAIRSVHRVDGGRDYYYLHNSSAEPVDAVVSLAGRRNQLPYSADAWTGEIAPIAEYAAERRRIRTAISLGPDEAELIVLGPRRWAGTRAPRLHATDSTADDVRAVDGELVLRDASAGSYTTTLSSGRTVNTEIRDLPRRAPLARWDLSVDEYLPGTAEQPSSHTEHVERTFDEIELAPWSEIGELTDAVGIGTYTTTLTLPPGWTGRNGGYLDLGAVHGSYRVRVNGRSVGAVNQLEDRVDVGAYLQTGANEIEVEVATTMINRLRVFRPAEYGDQAKQDYGLIGPVVLTPYGEAAIGRRR